MKDEQRWSAVTDLMAGALLTCLECAKKRFVTPEFQGYHVNQACRKSGILSPEYQV